MDRKYFTINEDGARVAHELMSFSDYKSGSATAEYHATVDAAYDIADKVADKRPDDAERAYIIAERYSKKMADYYNRDISIGKMCPSVMISGGGNFPVKKKERQIAAWDRNQEFYTATQKLIDNLNHMLNGSEVIRSNDEKAIEKLEYKIADLKELQERMKSANKAIRLKDTEHGDDLLREMGFSEDAIRQLREPDFCGRVGYPSFLLTNNNANIHRLEERLESLKSVKEQGTAETEYNGFRVVENTEAMRYQILFDEKPDADVRSVLKSNGFKWAPSQSAWQRQITTAGKYALDKVVNIIKDLER